MAPSQSAVKEQVSKTVIKNKGNIRILKNVINKPRNDYPEFADGQTFVLAKGDEVLIKLTKKGKKVIISNNLPQPSSYVKIINLFTGLDIADEVDDNGEIKLYQISQNGAELCRLTVGGGLIANIKKPDAFLQLEAWVEV